MQKYQLGRDRKVIEHKEINGILVVNGALEKFPVPLKDHIKNVGAARGDSEHSIAKYSMHSKVNLVFLSHRRRHHLKTLVICYCMFILLKNTG